MICDNKILLLNLYYATILQKNRKYYFSKYYPFVAAVWYSYLLLSTSILGGNVWSLVFHTSLAWYWSTIQFFLVQMSNKNKNLFCCYFFNCKERVGTWIPTHRNTIGLMDGQTCATQRSQRRRQTSCFKYFFNHDSFNAIVSDRRFY